MAINSEPNLRVVRDPAAPGDGSDDGAKTLVDSPALSPPVLEFVAGEISSCFVDGAPGTTLIGAAPAPGAHPSVQRPLVVNGKHGRLEPSVVVELPEPTPLDVDQARTIELRVNPDPEPVPVPAPAKWQVFDELGLAPRAVTKRAQKLVVSAYRLLGFGILTVIVAVLVSYIANTAFFYFNKTWITPVALSPNDEKVVALQGQLAQQLNERDRLASELAQSEKSIVAEQDFQLQFARAIRKDADVRRVALDRVKELATKAAATREEIRTTNGDYSQSTVDRMGKEYEAGLIDRNAMLAGKFQLAQISNANLSLAEHQVEFDQRAAELGAQTESLDALLADKQSTAALSYDVLKIARDYQTSKLAVAKETANREQLKASLERMETIINGVKQSAYLRAASDGAQVALVPYANMKNAAVGTPVYACKLSMVFCREVGKVKDILSGEVEVKQPNRASTVRGQMVEMEMNDESAAQDDVLFLGSRPLGV